jgi:hypothetical protein
MNLTVAFGARMLSAWRYVGHDYGTSANMNYDKRR